MMPKILIDFIGKTLIPIYGRRTTSSFRENVYCTVTLVRLRVGQYTRTAPIVHLLGVSVRVRCARMCRLRSGDTHTHADAAKRAEEEFE